MILLFLLHDVRAGFLLTRWLNVSLRQNGVGHDKTYADAILPKGHVYDRSPHSRQKVYRRLTLPLKQA
jgi:hypothetical protein